MSMLLSLIFSKITWASSKTVSSSPKSMCVLENGNCEKKSYVKKLLDLDFTNLSWTRQAANNTSSAAVVNVHYSPCYWCSLTDQSERPVGELSPFGWIKLKQ